MAETGYYDSPMTGEELDAAFAKMAGIDESVQQAGQSAETARQYGQIVEQNAQAIRDIEENLDVILEAPSQAQAASQSAAQAAASEASAAGAAAQAGQSASAAAESAELAQQVAQGAQGWYETEEALRAAHPTGENGQWAIVGSTDTIWTWDSDTGDWKNTSVKTDLSGYYTKEQSEKRFEMPVGYIFDWAPVEGNETDLSTAEKVAEHFGYGSWKEISGKFTFGCNEEYPAGSAGGEATHTLSLNEIPAHTHQVPIHWKSDASNYDLSYSSGKHLESSAGWTTGAAGGGQAHNNMPPYLAVYKWQRVA